MKSKIYCDFDLGCKENKRLCCLSCLDCSHVGKRFASSIHGGYCDLLVNLYSKVVNKRQRMCHGMITEKEFIIKQIINEL